MDRHGKTLKESDKLNFSLVKKTSLESTCSNSPFEEADKSADEWANFNREDLIGDLEYYRGREKQLADCIQVDTSLKQPFSFSTKVFFLKPIRRQILRTVESV